MDLYEKWIFIRYANGAIYNSRLNQVAMCEYQWHYCHDQQKLAIHFDDFQAKLHSCLMITDFNNQRKKST